jgi:hypothetical protein
MIGPWENSGLDHSDASPARPNQKIGKVETTARTSQARPVGLVARPRPIAVLSPELVVMLNVLPPTCGRTQLRPTIGRHYHDRSGPCGAAATLGEIRVQDDKISLTG